MYDRLEGLLAQMPKQENACGFHRDAPVSKAQAFASSIIHSPHACPTHSHPTLADGKSIASPQFKLALALGTLLLSVMCLAQFVRFSLHLVSLLGCFHLRGDGELPVPELTVAPRLPACIHLLDASAAS